MTQGRTPEEVFGAQVRKARELRGWTQERLRAMVRESSGIDLSSTAMARLEQGKRPIRLNEVAALAGILRLGLDKFAGGPDPVTEYKYREAMKELDEATAREHTVLHRLQNVKDRMRQVQAEHEVLLGELHHTQSVRARLSAVVAEYERARANLLDEVLDEMDLDRYPNG